MSTLDGMPDPAFFQRLQQVADKIHATQDIDEIMLELSDDICELFGAERLTIYATGADGASLESKVKSGLNSFKQLKLPISAQSIAGYVALSGRALNLLDVYDEDELKRHSPELSFQKGVDRRTGYRTKQMLVAPVFGEPGGSVLGVIQLINNRRGEPFPAVVEQGLLRLCAAVGIDFQKQTDPARAPSPTATLAPAAPTPAALAQAQAGLAQMISSLVMDTHRHGISELHIETTTGEDGAIRFQVSGVLKPPQSRP